MTYIEFKETPLYAGLPYGELTESDEMMLFKYAQGKVLEIGTFLGRSTAIMSAKADWVDTFDLFEYIMSIVEEKNRMHYEELFRKYPHSFSEVREFLSRYPNVGVHLRTEKSLKRIATASQPFDLVFLDADHSEKGVESDFNEVIPFVKRKGVVLFHDSFQRDTDSSQEVYKFLERMPSYIIKIDQTPATGSITVWEKE